MYDPDSGRVGMRALLWDNDYGDHSLGPATGPVAPDKDMTRYHKGRAWVVRKGRAQLYLKHRVIFEIMGHRHQRKLKFRDGNPDNWSWDNIGPRPKINETGHPLIYLKGSRYQVHIMLGLQLAYVERYETLTLALRKQKLYQEYWERYREQLTTNMLIALQPSEIIRALTKYIEADTEKEPT